MNDVFFLAARYLRHHWRKSLILTGSIALILFLPAGLYVLVQAGATAMTSRADATPILVGSRGSAVDLTLSALYFRAPSVDPLEYRRVTGLQEEGLGTVVPLHLGFESRGHRIVGTTTDYLLFRGLAIEAGRRFAVLGECVVGSEVARSLGVAPGGHVISTPAGAFDVAGSFPLKMNVVGVLGPTGTEDDGAIFVDLKTAWVIAGLAHGHEDVTGEGILEDQGDNVVAKPSVLSYTEITDANRDSFHFHGNADGFPVHAALVAPRDRKSGAMLRGRFEGPDSPVQIVVPSRVVDDLVQTLFSFRDAVLGLSVGLGIATLATASLVFALSIRLRRREIDTMRKIGASSMRIRSVLVTEIVVVLVASLVIAAVPTVVMGRFGSLALRFLGAG
jgi:putative ABC transport system permease protein